MPADIFLLLRGLMLQLLAFDPTHRLSADAALRVMAYGSPVKSQRERSPPHHVAASAGNQNREDALGASGSDGDFWRLESILRVSGGGDVRACRVSLFVDRLLELRGI